MSLHISFISAGAGTGKTYRLTEELERALMAGETRPSGVIGTTFTNMAANELRERVRQRLITHGRQRQANRMGQALLGTVNSVCGRLLNRFAFEVGLSPNLEVVPEEDGQLLFNQAIETAISLQQVRAMNAIASRLGLKDWKSEVKNIVDAARANNMQPDIIKDFGKLNAEKMLSFFPKAAHEDFNQQLYKVISEAIFQIEGNEDSTKGTQAYKDLLRQSQENVSEDRLPWHTWVKLSKATPTKKSLPHAEPVQAIALNYDRHPGLHQDLRQYCETLFIIAADALNHYQVFKKDRGLIDFVDQEQLVLGALGHPSVFDVLQDELDLLLVDEFQDTSPIQLALFLKLADAAKEAVFVGDVKQAIYGFRGSDPELMQAVLMNIQKEGGQTAVLNKSWRSRPALVSYINSIFVPAFSDILPQSQVALTSAREEKTREPAVEHWSLKGKNAGLRAAALAEGIQTLIKTGYNVVDKLTHLPRPVRYEDIAVLTRTHTSIATLANAFSTAGIPIKMERTGLLDTPEARLALACLRRIADPKDTLASAEIITLSQCKSPEEWLEERFEHLASEVPDYLWGETGTIVYPVLKDLADQRDRLLHLTPCEVFEQALIRADIRRRIITWGPTWQRVRQRLQNLDALITFAGEYEEHCKRQQLAATIAGLILWLLQLKQAELDLQPKDPKFNAVLLSTHHGAKGLEWPVVISHGMEGDLWSGIWGLRIVSQTESIDLNDPLADRSIHYWPWPFGAQKKHIEVAERIENSSTGRLLQEMADNESKRLLYVSLTRARDLLILPFPINKKSGPWIDTLKSAWMIPEGAELKLPSKNIIPAASRELEAATEGDTIETIAYQSCWFEPVKKSTQKPKAVISPSAMPEERHAKVLEVRKTFNPIALKGKPEMDKVGQALHAVIAVEIIHPGNKQLKDIAQRIINSFELSTHLNFGDAVTCAKKFSEYIRKSFQPTKIFAEHPVKHLLENGQLVSGWIDVLIENSDGWIIIDHKSSSKPLKMIEAEALKYSGQLLAYKKGVETATKKKVLSSWIHFPVSGKIISLSI